MNYRMCNISILTAGLLKVLMSRDLHRVDWYIVTYVSENFSSGV